MCLRSFMNVSCSQAGEPPSTVCSNTSRSLPLDASSYKPQNCWFYFQGVSLCLYVESSTFINERKLQAGRRAALHGLLQHFAVLSLGRQLLQATYSFAIRHAV